MSLRWEDTCWNPDLTAAIRDSTDDWGHDDCAVCEAARHSKAAAADKLIERVRRWVSDHPIDPDHPCHCGLCTALRRYDSEVGQ